MHPCRYCACDKATSVSISNGKPGRIDYANSKTVSQIGFDGSTAGNGNMATQTGNAYISGTMTDSIEIPTASLGFSIMVSSKKQQASDCDNVL